MVKISFANYIARSCYFHSKQSDAQLQRLATLRQNCFTLNCSSN